MSVKFTDEALHQQSIAAAKRKFKIYPSAYANGWMVRHYKQLYNAKNKRSSGAFTGRSDSLKTWFDEDWKAINSSGKIVGECGGGETKGKVKCLPASKARSLSKKDRSRLAKRKQSQDPKAGRSGMPIMVSSKLDSIDLRWDSAIDRLGQKYGLHLDSWRRLGPNQRGKPCGRGWVGLRGACKRGKKSDDNAEKIKESKVELADKIRAKKGLRDRNAPKPVVEEPKVVKKTRAEVLQASLEKKKQRLADKFDQHYADVRSANGQPLNDKRNGQATLNRWEKQNTAIGGHMKEIEKTENAIDREKGLMRGVEEANKDIPTPISKLVESGTLTQWRKYPNRFFVPGVEKARIVWDPKKQELAYSHLGSITDKDQRAKFASTYNQLRKEIEAEPKKQEPETKASIGASDKAPKWASRGDLQGLRIEGSQYMAIPLNGRKNSKFWKVVNVSEPGTQIWQFGQEKAKDWLTQQAADEEESRKEANK